MTGCSEYITPAEQQEYLAYHCPRDCIDNLTNGLEELNRMELRQHQGKKRLVCGGMAAFDKGLTDFLNTWNEQTGDLMLLSEVTAEYRRYTKEKIRFPFLCTPHLLAKEIIVSNMPLPTTRRMKWLAFHRRCIVRAAEGLQEKYGDLGKDYALVWSWYAYRYCSLLLQKLRPKEVILWNAFYPFHRILESCCKKRRIPVTYMEFGCIPGTICIETGGQQGKSLVARDARSFMDLAVSVPEQEEAKQVLRYLKDTGLNRNTQPAGRLDMGRLSYWKPERKTVLFLGQNDPESGLVPRTRESRRYHSPIFSSTMEALEELRAVSQEQAWNLIYKPHPMMEANRRLRNYNMHNVDVVTDVNINHLIDQADLVVTIVSQGAYIGLIRRRPVLMLGYTQLRGKGCAYEAFSREEIQKTIAAALQKGYTQEQENAFEKHVAQLLKYYLYDDNCDRILRFGRSIRTWKTEKNTVLP